MCDYIEEEQNITIMYSSISCKDGGRFNVPKNTVLYITLYPKKHYKLSEIGYDTSKFEIKEDEELPDIFYYRDSEEGFGLAVSMGIVLSFHYEASLTKERNLMCPNSLR
jgi:hypothetical protein